MFGSENIETISVHFGDPGADNKKIHLWRAPRAAEVLRCSIAVQNAQGAGSAGEFTIHNFGTAGTAIKSTGGTVVSTMGGTAAAVRIGAATPTAGTVIEGTLAQGEWLVIDYQETGDFVEQFVMINLDVVYGVGA